MYTVDVRRLLRIAGEAFLGNRKRRLADVVSLDKGSRTLTFHKYGFTETCRVQLKSTYGSYVYKCPDIVSAFFTDKNCDLLFIFNIQELVKKFIQADVLISRYTDIESNTTILSCEYNTVKFTIQCDSATKPFVGVISDSAEFKDNVLPLFMPDYELKKLFYHDGWKIFEPSNWIWRENCLLAGEKLNPDDIHLVCGLEVIKDSNPYNLSAGTLLKSIANLANERRDRLICELDDDIKIYANDWDVFEHNGIYMHPEEFAAVNGDVTFNIFKKVLGNKQTCVHIDNDGYALTTDITYSTSSFVITVTDNNIVLQDAIDSVDGIVVYIASCKEVNLVNDPADIHKNLTSEDIWKKVLESTDAVVRIQYICNAKQKGLFDELAVMLKSEMGL